MHVQEWLDSVPAVAVYAVVALVIGVESLGIPLPGEIVLVSAALLSSQHSGINPIVLGACASLGAVIGDSIGYAIGRKGGRPLLAWLANKFPGTSAKAMWPPPSAPSRSGACGPSSSAASSPFSASSPAPSQAYSACPTGSS